MKFLICLLFLLTSSLVFAQTKEILTFNDSSNINIDFFNDDKPIELTLISDFKNLKKKKNFGNYQNAQLIYTINDTIKKKSTVKIKARGKFRRQHCFFPPIWVKWKKNAWLNNGKSIKLKLKMVTHCRGKNYEHYILKEFLCYKLYNVLTNNSLKVQLLDVQYVDTGKGKQKKNKFYAFFIEDLDMLLKRINALKVSAKGKGLQSAYHENAMTLTLFQYMIGNTDWAVPHLHNIKLVRPKDKLPQKNLIIPYDFDFSGIVNTQYSVPDEKNLPIKVVTERYYLGLCLSELDYYPVIQKFKDLKDKFYQEINDFEYLDDKSKVKMCAYLDSFFNLLEQKDFYEKCIKPTCNNY